VVYCVTSGELEQHAPSTLAARKQREQLLRHNVLAAMGDVPLHIVTVRPRSKAPELRALAELSGGAYAEVFGEADHPNRAMASPLAWAHR
jgi:hypothetical protein